MQTFLPYSCFHKSAQVLDYRRLGKQRVECKQMLTAMRGKTAWARHPCTKMWAEYPNALRLYQNIVIAEWVKRGYKNNMPYNDLPTEVEMPPWLGNEEFHARHRSKLLFKNPTWYSQFGWTETPDLPYLWYNSIGFFEQK